MDIVVLVWLLGFSVVLLVYVSFVEVFGENGDLSRIRKSRNSRCALPSAKIPNPLQEVANRAELLPYGHSNSAICRMDPSFFFTHFVIKNEKS